MHARDIKIILSSLFRSHKIRATARGGRGGGALSYMGFRVWFLEVGIFFAYVGMMYWCDP